MTQQEAPLQVGKPRSLVFSRRGFACALVLGAAGWTGYPWVFPPAQPSAGQRPARVAGSEPGARDSADRQQDSLSPATPEQPFLGEWRDNYRGERTLILRDDGTATMTVKLAGFAKKLFAEKLTFDIEWTLEDDSITLRTISGQPESKFNMIRKVYGDEATYKVLAVSSDQMRLLDGDGKQEYDWRRPETMYEDVAVDDR